VLKRLSEAEADGDPIHAVIRASGINYDGKTNGILAPSGASQASLLKEVYDRYGITPEEIGYVVTHGTGTRLGDPVEINALNGAFKSYTKRQGYCALTSSKTNFGHSFAASGLLSLISLVQSLRHELIPASLNCAEENDYIDWEASPFYVNKEKKPWPEQAGRRRLGAVSAFGASGTNAHVVVESYRDEPAPSLKSPPCFLLPLSAKNEGALQQKIKDMLEFVEQGLRSSRDLLEMSYTLLCGRHHFAHRCAIVVGDVEEAVHAWRQVGRADRPGNLFEGKVARNFAGQKAILGYAEELVARSRSLQGDTTGYRETLCALADLYCQGYEADWEQLYGSEKPRRISLPTYPFARERYWVPAAGQQEALALEDAEAPAAADSVPAETLLFAREWQPSAAPSGTAAERHIVVLSDRWREAAETLSSALPGAQLVWLGGDVGSVAGE
jgi:acyl transferase domain-containing protein